MKTLSDKAILGVIRHNRNSEDAYEGAEILLRRWGIQFAGDRSELIRHWSRLSLPSVNAAKKLAQHMAAQAVTQAVQAEDEPQVTPSVRPAI